jgi:hypothetical protein
MGSNKPFPRVMPAMKFAFSRQELIGATISHFSSPRNSEADYSVSIEKCNG